MAICCLFKITHVLEAVAVSLNKNYVLEEPGVELGTPYEVRPFTYTPATASLNSCLMAS